MHQGQALRDAGRARGDTPAGLSPRGLALGEVPDLPADPDQEDSRTGGKEERKAGEANGEGTGVDLLSDSESLEHGDHGGAGPGAAEAVRSAGLSLLVPRVTPPGREGGSPLIASSYCRTSCPGGEVGLARVALAPGLRRES